MTITISLNASPDVQRAVKVTPGAPFAEVDATCAHCGHALRVFTEGRQFGNDDRTHEAMARCFDCKKHVGLVTIEVSTMWGVREDAAVFAEVEERGGRIYDGSAA